MNKCKDCISYKELVFWNPLPDYKNISHCCTLWQDEGTVHQINDSNDCCEMWADKNGFIPHNIVTGDDIDIGQCGCGSKVNIYQDYCPHCGRKLNWG